ncbi:hypothetical protein NDU88_003770 [Pleurodeles waltl]|uniref:Uncharacterized protein n=1 Tax=Pleurodeles waltl TaxID=8319 RepID=A0AAV7M614_PLEWA|nr:hypothetical protein NDU88_003770 [Pleurodeles waltl]
MEWRLQVQARRWNSQEKRRMEGIHWPRKKRAPRNFATRTKRANIATCPGANSLQYTFYHCGGEESVCYSKQQALLGTHCRSTAGFQPECTFDTR